MWCDHPFSHRSRTTERTVGLGVGSDREVRGWGVGKFLKKRVGNIGGLAPLCQLCNYVISHPPIPGFPPFLVKNSYLPKSFRGSNIGIKHIQFFYSCKKKEFLK